MFDKVAITGAAGRIAEYVIEDLKGTCELTLLDIAPASSMQELQRVDICDLESLRQALGSCQAVIHLAAVDVQSPDQSIFRTNAFGTWNILQLAEELGIRKAVIMSSEAGLGMEYLDVDPPPLYVPIDEDHPFRPSDSYGVSKEICECIGRKFARRGGLSVVCLRPTEVMFGDVAEQVAGLLDRENDLGTVQVTRRSDNVEGLAISRAYVRADDMARMIRLALEVETGPYEVFWASAADTYAPQPTLDLLTALYGSIPEIRKPDLYRTHPRASVFDITAARERLGWKPTSEWEATLEELRS